MAEYPKLTSSNKYTKITTKYRATTAENHLKTKDSKKKPDWDGQEEQRQGMVRSRTHGVMIYKQEGNQQHNPPWGVRCLSPKLGSLAQRIYARKEVPTISGFENQ